MRADRACRHLRQLVIDGTGVRDTGMKELAKLKDLQWLSLHETQVTDAGIRELSDLNQLTELKVTINRVTPAMWIAHWVFIRGGTLTIDDGKERTVASLKELPTGAWSLIAIDLHDKLVIGKVPWHNEINRLRGLNLKGTLVSDEGLKDFAAIKTLKEVDLTDTNVTPEGVAELRKALPGCKIVGDPAKP